MWQYDTLQVGLPKRFLLFYMSKVITSSSHEVLSCSFTLVFAVLQSKV